MEKKILRIKRYLYEKIFKRKLDYFILNAF